MGDTIWVDVRDRDKDKLPQDNSIILRLKDQLDRLSKQLKVAKLSDFYDYSDLEAAYGDFDEDDDEVSADEPVGSWFDAAKALKAVRAIRTHLLQHPDALAFQPGSSRTHWPQQLMDELEHCQDVLEDAVARGVQFRFLIVA